MIQLQSRFPVWQYLNQPLFRVANPVILNPRRFWYYYRVELLERCFIQKCESHKKRD